MSKPKVLQLCAVDWSVTALLQPLIDRSMEEGYEVHTVCTNTGRFTELNEKGYTMIDISIDRKISPVRNIKSILKLYKLMKKEKYDIVHVHTPIAALLGRVAAKMAGIKNIVYTAHGFYFHDEMSKAKYSAFFNIEKYAARWLTDWLLLQSKEDYELSIKNKFSPPEKIMHLSNGVDIWNKFHPEVVSEDDLNIIKRENEIEKSDFVFSFVGRLVKEKGIFELIEAFKDVSKIHSNAKLILIGGLLESERDHTSYENLTQELKHPGIIYLGFRTDIPELMKITDTFILPSYREGLPRSIIEAMAMETAIIATNIRGCREEVFPGKNGLLVEKENTNDLREAMLKLLEEPLLAKTYGQQSREIAEEFFDEEKVLQKQMKLFKSLV